MFGAWILSHRRITTFDRAATADATAWSPSSTPYRGSLDQFSSELVGWDVRSYLNQRFQRSPIEDSELQLTLVGPSNQVSNPGDESPGREILRTPIPRKADTRSQLALLSKAKGSTASLACDWWELAAQKRQTCVKQVEPNQFRQEHILAGMSSEPSICSDRHLAPQIRLSAVSQVSTANCHASLPCSLPRKSEPDVLRLGLVEQLAARLISCLQRFDFAMERFFYITLTPTCRFD